MRVTLLALCEQGEEAGASSGALQRPQFNLAEAISMRAAKWGTAPGLAVRFTLLCNGEATECVCRVGVCTLSPRSATC